MKIRFTPEAEEQVDAIDKWWRENRKDAVDSFVRELASTIALISASSKIGTVYTILDGLTVRKLFMPKTRHHVYYALDPAAAEVVVHAVWGAPKRRGPKL
jgi:plasmid stabilization system protein ParE